MHESFDRCPCAIRSGGAYRQIWRGSVQAQNRGESVVEGPDLLDCDATDPLAQTLDVDRSELLDEDPCDSATNFDLGSERSWTGAARCWCHDHDRPRQEFIGLHHDRAPLAGLLMSDALRYAKSVHLTAPHASTPSVMRPKASQRGPRRRLRSQLLLPRVDGVDSTVPLRRATRTGSLQTASSPKPRAPEEPAPRQACHVADRDAPILHSR